MFSQISAPTPNCTIGFKINTKRFFWKSNVICHSVTNICRGNATSRDILVSPKQTFLRLEPLENYMLCTTAPQKRQDELKKTKYKEVAALTLPLDSLLLL